MLLAEVAGVATDARLAMEVLLVDVENQADHLARGLLLLFRVAGHIPLVSSLFVNVAEVAMNAERGSEVVHDLPELGIGEVGEQLHVLLFGARRNGRDDGKDKDDFPHRVSFVLCDGG